jgi:anthranilate phosphoribosyltransferase
MEKQGDSSAGGSPSDDLLPEALGELAAGRHLGRELARAAMDEILSGRATAAQIGAFLMGLRMKGETVEEVAGLVEGMRAAGVRVESRRRDLVDLCGTGGDGRGTFNISTGAALVTAAAGAPVAKHGNRSASSLCGSADVLEALGVPIDLPPERAQRALDDLGFCFFFAPSYHPAMRQVGPARRELRLRTVFNILGPLSSPAGVTRQLVGVFQDSLRSLVARVLSALGSERAWVVHGAGGLDELSIAGETAVTVVDSEGEREIVVAPQEAKLERHALEKLRGGDACRNAAILEQVLAGESGACRDAVLLNAAAALVVQGRAADLRHGAALAAEAIDSGAARGLVEKLRAFA